MQFLVDLIVGLIPQKDDDTMTTYWWKLRSVVLGLIALSLGLWATNLAPFVHAPYTQAITAAEASEQLKLDATNLQVGAIKDQLQIVVSQLKAGQVRSLSTDLIEATRYKCRAHNTGGDGTEQFWTTRLQGLKLDYYNLTQSPWSDVPCSSF